MKDYYQILKIPRSASEGEIKRSFRLLAVKLHPDKNPNNQTVALFQEINEAYEVLSDKDKKWVYDQKYDAYYSPNKYGGTVGKAPSPSYTRANYSRPRYSAPSRSFDYSDYAPFFRKVNWGGMFLCLILIFDYVFTIDYPNQKITWIDDIQEVRTRNSRGYSKRNPSDVLVDIETEKFQFQMEIRHAAEIEIGDNIDVYMTPLFQIARWVDVRDKAISIAPHYGVYNNFVFIPAILLILSCIGLFVKRNEKFVVDIGIGAMIFFVLTVIFIVISR
jgi:hypothetical protein